MSPLAGRFLWEGNMAWGKPVDIELHGTGRYRVVTNTSMAADCLIESWPHKGRREKYWKAVESCLADLDGKPSHPRTAFLAAAKESGLSIRSARRQSIRSGIRTLE
ncbi:MULTISPECIES: DUF982 domain-containing protein [Brucella]